MVNRVSLAAIIGRLRARMMKINAYLNSAKAGDSLYVLLLSQKQPLLKTVNFSSSFFNRKIDVFTITSGGKLSSCP